LTDVLEIYLSRRRLSKESAYLYRLAARRWAEATGDPPLCELRLSEALAFPGYLAESGRAQASIARDMRHVQMLLNFAGPKNGRRSGPWDLGLFGFTPIYLRGKLQGLWPRSAPQLSESRRRENDPEGTSRPIWTPEQRRAVWEACRYARRPRLDEVSACQWWRCALDVATGSGLRRRTILALERSWLREASPGQWILDIPAWAVKSRRRTLIYANRLVRDAIAAMPTGDIVFPWPYRIRGEEPNWRPLHEEFQRIMNCAGLPAEARRGAGFHSCRRVAGDYLYCRDPAVARETLGHASEWVTRAHYTQAVSRALAGARVLEEFAEAELRGRS
jgi:hypothetical protein